MSTFYIPNSQGQIRQSNNGDAMGELWGTFNIDTTSNAGKMKVSKVLRGAAADTVMDNDEVGTFSVFNNSIWAFGAGRRWNWEASRNPREALGTSSTASFAGRNSDSVVFDGKLLISTSTNIASTSNGVSFDDDWWTTVVSGTALQTANPHIMEVLQKGRETLFVTDENRVRYYNTTAGHSTVTLPTQFVACCLAPDYQAMWVGTYNNQGKAQMFEIYVGETIDSTPVYRNSYDVEGTAVLSVDVIDGIPWIVTNYGHIQTFNGRAFVTVASFPFAYDGVAIDGNSVGEIDFENSRRGIHPKGMRRYNKSLLININTNNQLIDDLAANPDDNDDVFENIVVNERSPSGIWEYNTETGSLNHRYSLTNGGKNYTTTAKGYHRQLEAGPILVIDNQYTRLLTAGRVDSATTEIFVEDPDISPLGYFITPEITAQTVQEAWDKVVLKTDTLEAGESIEVKYRTRKRTGYPKYTEANWIGTNSFVSTSDCSMVEIGDEVEIIDGYGAGLIAHVTDITTSSTTYTFTLDTAIGLNSETSNVRFQNWTKIDVTYDENDGEFKVVGITETNPWIQFKVVLNGAITVRQFISKGNSKTEL
jgi:hypothetical protein